MIQIKKIFYFIQISRPVNFVITLFSVIVAGLISNNNSVNINILLAAFSAGFTASAGNIINDIFDIKIDKLNKPQRVIPSNKLSIKEAKSAYLFLNLTAIVLAFFINFAAIFIVVISILTIFSYSAYFKKVVLAGNIIVSFFTGLVFIYGGIAVNNYSAAIIPALFAFLTNLIRELIKDIEDIKGDASNNVITFPSKFGIRNTKNLIFFLTVLLMFFTTVPYYAEIYKIEFFIIAMAFINPLFILMLKKLFSSDEIIIMKKCSNIIKINMIIGLTAIYLGAV